MNKKQFKRKWSHLRLKVKMLKQLGNGVSKLENHCKNETVRYIILELHNKILSAHIKINQERLNMVDNCPYQNIKLKV